MKKSISYKNINSVAGVAKALGMNPKVARAKLRRHGKAAPVTKTQGLTSAQAAKVGTFLQTDLRLNS